MAHSRRSAARWIRCYRDVGRVGEIPAAWLPQELRPYQEDAIVLGSSVASGTIVLPTGPVDARAIAILREPNAGAMPGSDARAPRAVDATDRALLSRTRWLLRRGVIMISPL